MPDSMTAVRSADRYRPFGVYKEMLDAITKPRDRQPLFDGSDFRRLVRSRRGPAVTAPAAAETAVITRPEPRRDPKPLPADRRELLEYLGLNPDDYGIVKQNRHGFAVSDGENQLVVGGAPTPRVLTPDDWVRYMNHYYTNVPPSMGMMTYDPGVALPAVPTNSLGEVDTDRFEQLNKGYERDVSKEINSYLSRAGSNDLRRFYSDVLTPQQVENIMSPGQYSHPATRVADIVEAQQSHRDKALQHAGVRAYDPRRLKLMPDAVGGAARMSGGGFASRLGRRVGSWFAGDSTR